MISTEMFMPSSRDGIRDMFFPQPFDYGFAIENCNATWGVEPRPYWVTINFGGKQIDSYSNIIFSNGEYVRFSTRPPLPLPLSLSMSDVRRPGRVRERRPNHVGKLVMRLYQSEY